VLLAQDGRSALALYELERPDLVLMDVLMPGMSGTQLAEKIKDIDPHARMIVLTCMDETREVVKLMRLGVLEYLVKPCERDELLAAVNRSLSARTLMEPTYVQTPTTCAVEDAVRRAVAEKVPLILSGRSGSGRHTILKKALSDLGFTRVVFAPAAAGNVAGTLRKALARYDDAVEAVCLEFAAEGDDEQRMAEARLLVARVRALLDQLRESLREPVLFVVGLVDVSSRPPRPPRGPEPAHAVEAYVKSPGERPEELPAMVRHFCSLEATPRASFAETDTWLRQLSSTMAYSPRLDTVRFVRAAAMRPALVSARA
jgi:CheY-like chemotaxis protein